MVVVLALTVVLAVAAVAAVALAVQAGRRASLPAAAEAPTPRSVLLHLLLLVGVLASAVGAAGLLGQLLVRLDGGGLAGAAVEAARNVALLVVGAPLALLAGGRVARQLRSGPAARRSLPWAGYVTVVSLVGLAMAMTSLHGTLVWAFGVGQPDPRGLARALVWSSVWAVHARLDRVVTPAAHARPHLLAGSAIAVATCVVGLVGVVGNSLDVLLGLRMDAYTDPRDQLLRGAATLLVGAASWVAYWWYGAVRGPRTGLDDVYAVAVGTLAGTVTAVVGTTWVLTDVLVWFAGTPGTTDAAEHFRVAPHAATAALAGVALRAYHERLLGPGRAERHRLRDYTGVVLGVLAAAVGTDLLVVAAVEVATGPVPVALGTPTSTTAFIGAVLVWIGLLVRWLGGRPAQVALRADPGPEQASVVRRACLLALTGAGLLVAVGALVAAVYLVLRDAFQGAASSGTLRSARYALGLLVAAAAVTATHAAPARDQWRLRPGHERRLRLVVLAGPVDPVLRRALQEGTGAHVVCWPRTDVVPPGAWPVEDVVRSVASSPGPDVIVVATAAGPLVVPVDRSGRRAEHRQEAPAGAVR